MAQDLAAVGPLVRPSAQSPLDQSRGRVPDGAACPACMTLFSADAIASMWAEYRTFCVDAAFSSAGALVRPAHRTDGAVTVSDVAGKTDAIAFADDMTVQELMDTIQNTSVFKVPVRQQMLLFQRQRISVRPPHPIDMPHFLACFFLSRMCLMC